MSYRKRGMGKISTGALVGILGGVAVLGYLMMNKSTTPTTVQPLPPGYINPAAAQAQAQASTTNTAINDASSTINNIINSIWS